MACLLSILESELNYHKLNLKESIDRINIHILKKTVVIAALLLNIDILAYYSMFTSF